MCEDVRVEPYSHDNLRKILAHQLEQHAHVTQNIAEQLVSARLHDEYFKTYFIHLDAKTVVIEEDYIDRDFLEDYAAYYVRCFKPYKSHCTRLHFFAIHFDAATFAATLSDTNGAIPLEDFQKSYLGFVVVKPLPKTIIGRTCLRTYLPEKRRCFPVTRNYPVNLFGLDLSVETLAFQEQDSVAAACATSALWSAFQGTGKLFQHHIPSPIEITATASEHWMSRTRSFPNTEGLNGEQMAYAIRKVGLEPYVINPESEFMLRLNVNAYLQCGIPLLLGGTLSDHTPRKTPKDIGKHAVAITGFSMGGTVTSATDFCLMASQMDKIYVHDDQVGPFARMNIHSGYLDSSFRMPKQLRDTTRFKPEILIVPLYHKIRIPFSAINETMRRFNAALLSQPVMAKTLRNKLVWDIRLTTVNQFKHSLRNAPGLDSSTLLYALTKPLPRYLWRVTAYYQNKQALDLLLDATDIEQGDGLCLVIEYSAFFSQILRLFANKHAIDPGKPEWHIIQYFCKNTPSP